jgi:hypothetical protein
MSPVLARKQVGARRTKNPRAKGKGRKKPSRTRPRSKDDELVQEEKYSYTGTFKPKKDEA